MPPLPTSPDPPAISIISSSIVSTTSTSFPSPNLGSLSYNPSMSVKITRTSADARFTTMDERRSLSENLISSTATVSFSLITGMTPSFMSSSIVLRALTKRFLSARPSLVSNICPTVIPCFEKADSYACIRRLWPMAARACFAFMVAGIFFFPVSLIPINIAPELTITNWYPSLLNDAISPARDAIRAWSTPPLGASSTALPSLTTIFLRSVRSFFLMSLTVFSPISL